MWVVIVDMAAPHAPVNMTVYEFLEQASLTYRGGAGGAGDAGADLYYQCARFISLFTIADLRHDFQNELDIPFQDKTIGQSLCEFICAAYFDAGPAYDTLLTEIQTL